MKDTENKCYRCQREIFNTNNHIGIKSCLELEQVYKLMNKGIKKFKGEFELDESL